MKKKNLFGVLLLGLFLALLAVNIVSADSYQLRCLTNGQSINFGVTCATGRPIVTAPNPGSESICVHVLDNGKVCNASPNTCNGLGLSCSNGDGGGGSGGNTTFSMLVNNPINNKLYSSARIYFDIKLNKRGDIGYIDTTTGRLAGLCRNCASYTSTRGFKEGLNNITIQARDSAGKVLSKNIAFTIDSRKPVITKTNPKNKFAGGLFSVGFIEQNPKNLTITYGNLIKGMKTVAVNLNSCTPNGREKRCDIKVNLKEYDGQEIMYLFNITDIVGNSAVSRPIAKLSVDTSAPKINNFNYTIISRNVKFTFNVTEPNFDKIQYIDNSDLRPRLSVLCSSLRKDICQAQRSFKPGNHRLTIIINDKAGNAVNQTANFTI